jgi:hypothetical protein
MGADMSEYFIETWMLALILVICAIHAHRFEKIEPIGPLFHFVWAGVYGLGMAFWYLLLRDDLLMLALLVLRFVAYNPLLNWMREKDWWYVGSGVNGSWWDRLEEKYASVYKVLWFAVLVELIIIQFQL